MSVHELRRTGLEITTNTAEKMTNFFVFATEKLIWTSSLGNERPDDFFLTQVKTLDQLFLLYN